MKDFLRELMKKAYFAIPPRFRPYIFSAIFGNKLFRRWLGPIAFRSLKRSGGLESVHAGERLFRTRLTPEFAKPVPKLDAYQSQSEFRVPGKIGVAIHAYYLDELPELLQCLKNIPCGFNLYITTPENSVERVSSLAEKAGFKAAVIGMENKGYDLLPFVKLLPKLISDGVEVVCKLHTKKGAANLEGLYPGIEPVWSDLLVKPILGSEETVAGILDAFASHPDLGMVGSASMYRSAQDLMYGNQADVIKIVSQIDDRELPLENWGFFAGSMFWCRVNSMESLGAIVDLNAVQNESNNGDIASYWHALERVLGYLPNLVGQKVALSFARNIENTEHAISILKGGHKRVLLNPIGIGFTPVTELSVREDFELLQSSFRDEDYAKSSANLLGIDPVLYYLKYGVFFGEELVSDFNSHAYWQFHKDVFESRLNPLVHFVRKGRDEGRVTFPAKQNLSAARRILEGSSLFHRQFYLSENPDIAFEVDDPLGHFCEMGWMELRDPSPGFEIWNYWQQHLDPRRAIINPAVFQAVLDASGHAVRDDIAIHLSNGYELPSGQPIRRVCLFAGYDPDDYIDESVINYIKELSRYADVYYLSDGEMPESELRKLNGLVKGAWSIRHRQYDFGSYSRLALGIVGWAEIEKYDELILANDSCYLIRPLSRVFERMERSKCDWWGLQATKGVRKTMWNPSNRFKKSIPIKAVKASKLSEYEKEPFYDFHIGSYFLVFRPPVLKGNELRRILGSVQPEINKLNVIRKNEIGLTRSLIRAGYNFDTYIDEILPFHPLYTKRHFVLIEKGFPLLKRLLLSENHYRVPDLWRWEGELKKALPHLDLGPIKSNLLRVSNPTKLYRNLRIKAMWGMPGSYPRRYSKLEFALRDKFVKKLEDVWSFPVCAFDNNLSGNDRAIFELVKDDPSIKKVILVREKNFRVTGSNVEVAPLKSLAGQKLLLRSKVVFIKHTVPRNVELPLDPKLHDAIGLWHGIPLKRIGYASLDLQDHLKKIARAHSKFRAVICSSEIDHMAMACGFYPLSYQDIWMTGLPRIDFILKKEKELPQDMHRELSHLDELLGGRRLLLFCPTFRNDKDNACYEFSAEEKSRLNQVLRENNVVLGVREHMTVKSNGYLNALSGLPLLNLDNRRFKDVEMLFRKADFLMTDYSSCYIDFMVTGRPIIVFAYDYDRYAGQERGLFYDLHTAVPGPVCTTFRDLISNLEQLLQQRTSDDVPAEYVIKRRMFHAFTDGKNSERVVEAVKRLD